MATPTAGHNTGGYAQGCRCAVCVAAKTESQRRYRAQPEKRQREAAKQRERYVREHPDAKILVGRKVVDALERLASMEAIAGVALDLRVANAAALRRELQARYELARAVFPVPSSSTRETP